MLDTFAVATLTAGTEKVVLIFFFFLTSGKVTVSNKKAQKAVSASLIQQKLLEVARSTKSSVSELACK